MQSPPPGPRVPLQHTCTECGHRFVANKGDVCPGCMYLAGIAARKKNLARDQAQIGRWL